MKAEPSGLIPPKAHGNPRAFNYHLAHSVTWATITLTFALFCCFSCNFVIFHFVWCGKHEVRPTI